MFSTSRNKSLSPVLKPCKTVQETSEEVLFIKVEQISRQIHIYRDLMMNLDSYSTETVSIENYEIQISRFDFTHIQVYSCRVSFLTTLDIYKDYFKGYHTRNQSISSCIVWPETKVELLRLCAKGFITKGLFDLHHLDELKNFVANNFLKLVC